MTTPDPDKYLQAFRATQDPSPARLNAVLGKIEHTASLGPGPGGGTPGAGIVVKGALAAAAVGVVAAVVLGSGGQEAVEPASAPEVVSAEPAAVPSAPIETGKTAPPAPDPAPDPAPEPAPEPAPAAAQSADPPRRPRIRAAKEAPGSHGEPPRPSPAPDLARDVGLMKEIRADIVGGRHRDALHGIAEHHDLFPDSVLSNERTVLEAEALCGSGKHADARATAAGFLESHPGSPLAARARHACPK